MDADMKHTPLLALYLTPREFAMLEELVIHAAYDAPDYYSAEEWKALADLRHTVDAVAAARLQRTEAER